MQQTVKGHEITARKRRRREGDALHTSQFLRTNVYSIVQKPDIRLNKWALVPPWEEVDPEKKQKLLTNCRYHVYIAVLTRPKWTAPFFDYSHAAGNGFPRGRAGVARTCTAGSDAQ